MFGHLLFFFYLLASAQPFSAKYRALFFVCIFVYVTNCRSTLMNTHSPNPWVKFQDNKGDSGTIIRVIAAKFIFNLNAALIHRQI